MRNNFIYGKPIYDPDLFVGRERELKQIADRLLNPGFENIELIGERRVGKTSILIQLAQEKTAGEYGLSFDTGYVGLYIDMGLCRTTSDFWSIVLRDLRDTLQDRLPNTPALDAINEELERDADHINSRSLQSVLRVAERSQLRIFVMCDEFEKISHNPDFDYAFYGELRALLLLPNFAMITSTRYELRLSYTSEEILGSPFFNVLNPMWLGTFLPDDVERFIGIYQDQCEYEFTKPEIMLLDLLGGRFPFYMQLAGSIILRYHIEQPNALSQRNISPNTWVANEFLLATESRFNEMWSGFDSEQKSLLLAAAQNKINLEKAVDDPRNPALKFLRRGTLIEREGKIEIFSRAFAHWIRHVGSKPETGTHPPPIGENGETSKTFEAPVTMDLDRPFAFISYSHRNMAFAMQLVERLNRATIETWIDKRNISLGENWDHAIERAITHSTVVLIILSPDSVSSPNVMDEISYTLSCGKAIVPIMYRPCSVPLRIQRLQYVDFQEEVEEAFQQLLHELQKYFDFLPST